MNWEATTGTIAGYLWALPLIIVALTSGLIYSIRLGFPQIRRIKDMVKYLVGGKASEEGISSFQGFAMSLGGRIGIGNIAGVATAIFFGGPGAIFWMWVIAFVGAGSAMAESTLGNVYKTKVGGEYRGGPAFYIEKGLKMPIFAIVFAIVSVISNAITGPTIQAYNVAESFKNAWGVEPIITAVALTVIFALVALGGMKRIGKFAQYVVPFMALAYIVIAIIVLLANITRIGPMFKLIFSCAFNLNAVFGAIWGQSFMWGVKRGIFSNEAGFGTGAHAAASAEVSHPVKQGLAQSFSVYIDTLFVCTATGIMILATGLYNVQNLAGDGYIVENLHGVDHGVGYTQAAIDSMLPGMGSGFVAIAIFFFTLTTLLAFAFNTDAGISYIFRNKSRRTQKIAVNSILFAMVLITFFGSMTSTTVAWNIADMGTAILAWVNLPAIILLSPKVIKIFRDYDRQRKMGLDPVFEPSKLGIDNAEIWDEIVAEKYSDLLELKREAERKANL